MRKMTPMGALLRGVIAGAIGAGVQTLFFRLTSKIAPETPKDVFEPPEPQQKQEKATVTVARRLVEDLMQAGPLRKKELAGRIVHVAFGAAWGGLYGLARRSTRLMRGPVGGPLGSLAFGAVVWGVGDNLVLPAFRLAAWPGRYPLKTHAYALLAHLVYGSAAWGAFELETTRAFAPLVAALGARWATRSLPGIVRPVVREALVARSGIPIERVRDRLRDTAVSFTG